MPVVYSKCGTDVRDIGKRITKQYHRELLDCEATVAYLFASAPKNEKGEALSPAVTVGGYPCAAKVKVIGLKERADGRADAEVVIDEDEWNGLTETQRDALIDHELYHLQVKMDPDSNCPQSDDLGRPKLTLRKHDHQFGWFDAIARRHADASYEVKQAKAFADGFGQLYFGWKSPPKSEVESLPSATKKPVRTADGRHISVDEMMGEISAGFAK